MTHACSSEADTLYELENDVQPSRRITEKCNSLHHKIHKCLEVLQSRYYYCEEEVKGNPTRRVHEEDLVVEEMSMGSAGSSEGVRILQTRCWINLFTLDLLSRDLWCLLLPLVSWSIFCAPFRVLLNSSIYL